MLSEHNPIAELVHQIQEKWKNEVSPYPYIKLVRWLIDPQQARLYEGFLKLESTEHGALPEVVVTMLTPFKSEESFSAAIMNDWINTFSEDHKTKEKLSEKKEKNHWEPEYKINMTKSTSSDARKSLIQMLSGFRRAVIHDDINLVVALYPRSVHNFAGMNHWLIELVKEGIPEGISFMIFDHIGEYYFDDVCKRLHESTHTLNIDLDLFGAVQKISRTGNPNSPEVKLRECILEMGKSVQKKDEDRLHYWGEKALQATKRSNSNSLYASAHIVYAGMLFNFKLYEKIDTLLQQGIAIVKNGLQVDDPACKPLIIQYYGFIGASKQMQKSFRAAINAYQKQSETAISFGLPGMALTPYRLAYSLSKTHLPEQHADLLQKAYSTGLSLPTEEQANSSFPSVALDYLHWVYSVKTRQEGNETEAFLNGLLGANWKDQVKNPGVGFSNEKLHATILT